ncbi:hypothetical protein CDD81_4069 [Ophiocordyceps australis]|uniref:Exoribonuclease phosphorolytic domain-containing protein n=1 Tax=Ophiocordyceps australis TaxID=1399860 RepID=A0A2C5XV30_9HYPO|nr:hypothetical protein CDD81_4069 [Ophiocordyceps australis]
MTDRRRIHGPSAMSCPPIYEDEAVGSPRRGRESNRVRAVYLKTGVTPSAAGSAYIEFENANKTVGGSDSGGMKLTCTIHGPKSLPRSAPFSPHLVLSTHVKYAPFATRQRRGYLRDATERDLSIHLETALRGVLIADRWPKSGIDVVVTIIEGEVARHVSLSHGLEAWDTMTVLGGCITVAAAALADAGIDCVDTVVGGVAALVSDSNSEPSVVLDPTPAEHETILAACCVAYLGKRDEITNLWLKGRMPPVENNSPPTLISSAIDACRGTRQAIMAALVEAHSAGL